MPLHSLKKATALAGLVLVSACAVGPDYERPSMDIPAMFKEAAAFFTGGGSKDATAEAIREAASKPQDGWKPGTPRDQADRGAWWAIYDDPVLDGLERQVEVSNQNLKAAEAAYRQASAAIRAARASFFPTLTGTPSLQRRQGASSSSGGSSSSASFGSPPAETIYTLAGSASWELDVWGKIRRTVESDTATAQASAADLAAARLSAQATLATDYFELRIEDELKRLLDAAVAAYSLSLQITRNQYASGVASRADVAQAETQLKTTQAQAINVGVLRAELEHAIAVLTGKPPAEVTIAPAKLTNTIPVIPPGVPSTLLERRPDIAGAERRVAAANAQIGVATAAFYPDLTLSASLTYASTAVAGLLQTANRVWSFGPQASQILFDGGLRSAQVDEARAAWEQSTATYRQTVLAAFQQVEDQLAALRVLESQAAVQAEAVKSAQEAERLVLNQYKAGTVAYTTVVVAQTAALSNEQTALTILQNRLTASVVLIQALGGGWDASQLPEDPNGEAPGTPVAASAPRQGT